jgi:hypothetical protein
VRKTEGKRISQFKKSEEEDGKARGARREDGRQKAEDRRRRAEFLPQRRGDAEIFYQENRKAGNNSHSAPAFLYSSLFFFREFNFGLSTINHYPNFVTAI